MEEGGTSHPESIGAAQKMKNKLKEKKTTTMVLVQNTKKRCYEKEDVF